MTCKAALLNPSSCSVQAKKKFFDTELENLERQQKQQVEKMEQDHAVRRREEAKRIRLEQERDYTQFQEQLKLMKKEVSACWVEAGGLRALGRSRLRAVETSARPCAATGSLGGLVYPKKRMSWCVWVCGSACTIRSPSSITWALPASVLAWLPGRPSPGGLGQLPLYLPA